MSEYYRPQRAKNLFDPASPKPYRLSRSKLENFARCPRCFYLDRRLGVGEPPGYPFSLNAAVDHLLKKEFDRYRAEGVAHPLMTHYGLKAVPLKHPELEIWRDNFAGVTYHHQPTNFILTGAIDDLWQEETGEVIVVDYKATSKDEEVTLDAPWQKSYKRQLELYQWLLKMNGLRVSPTGYFVYVNGKRDRTAFDGRLEFDVKLIAYHGETNWVEPLIAKAKDCLQSEQIPPAGEDCDFCAYRAAAAAALKNQTTRAQASPGGQIALFS